MKVQILVGGQVANSQLVSIEAQAKPPTMTEVKRMALKAALEDRAITIGEALQASFRLFDVTGRPVED